MLQNLPIISKHGSNHAVSRLRVILTAWQITQMCSVFEVAITYSNASILSKEETQNVKILFQ